MAQQRIAQLSLGTDVSTTPPGVIDTRTLGKPKSFAGQTSEWTTWQFTFKAFACAVHPKMKEVFDLTTRKGADPVNASDITFELQSLSTQLYYMLVMMLSDQAQEIVRNSLEGIGAEVWRKLLWEHEPGVGIRYGAAMLQSLLKRRFGEHDETDLAREIESFERDISKYEQQSNDLISDAIKHGFLWHGSPRSETAHRPEHHSIINVQDTTRRDHQLQQSAKSSAYENQSGTTRRQQWLTIRKGHGWQK